MKHGGNDPKRNPLTARALSAPLLHEFSDADVISPEERARHPFWNEFYNRHGLPHYGVCNIWRSADSQIVLTLSRTETQGAIPENERSAFRRLAKRWHDAAMFVGAIKTDGAKLLTGTLDGLAIAALVLDGFGRVVAMTEAAQKIMRGGKYFRLKNGRIEAVRPDEESPLAYAAWCCVGSVRQKGRMATLRLQGSRASAITVRAWPLPRQNDLAFGAAALLILEPDGSPGLLDLGLTAAEIEVAGAVMAGEPVRDIALNRCATYETVRSQIKSIYSKAGVRSRAEFTARCRA
jgi:DNA-binding CsgD family transcriptional regulator